MWKNSRGVIIIISSSSSSRKQKYTLRQCVIFLIDINKLIDRNRSKKLINQTRF